MKIIFAKLKNIKNENKNFYKNQNNLYSRINSLRHECSRARQNNIYLQSN